MNRILTLLTYGFSVLGIITSVIYFRSDVDIIKYVQLSVVGFFVSDALREFTSEEKNKSRLIYKSVLAIIMSILIGFIYLQFSS